MLGRLLASVFRTADRAHARPARLQPLPDRQPFVAYLANVNRARFVVPGEMLTSRQASVRLRLAGPVADLSRRLPVCLLPLEYLLAHPDLSRLGAPIALVLGKLSSDVVREQQRELGRLVEWLEAWARRVRVVADLSDDYAALSREQGAPFLEEFQRALAAHCQITVPCAALADRFRAIARRGIEIVEDPWESPSRGTPTVRARTPLRLCWFGYLGQAAFPAVRDGFMQIATRLAGTQVEFEVVTATEFKAAVLALADGLSKGRTTARVRFREWSPEATWQAIADCDLVILPQDYRSAWGAVKSHNRLVEAIRGGRLAIASPIPSYVELAVYAWVGEDLGEGVAWALANPREAEARVERGQAHIEQRFAPEVVVRKWAEILGAGGRPQPASARPPPTAAGEPLRLNLGCGDKILPGYVNVDVAPGRAGRSPDVVCDLRKLEPFEADTVHEVLAVHVVEHFWRWEIVEVLREWVRVLKPGGRMIVECPNLLTACEELLNNPGRAAEPGPEGQRTMWVLYGDPSWRDPLMCHRWNYTPQSLKELLDEAGLVNVRQEPAQFKLREPRDMRIVGEKPAA